MKIKKKSWIEAVKDKIVKNVVIELLLFIVIIFSSLSPSFLTASNIISLLVENSSVIIMAVGLTFIIVSGGIDLSIGYQISLVSVTVGMLLAGGASILIATIAGITVGLLCGLINSMIIIGLKIPPFAATLATQIIFRSLTNLISGGRAYTQLPNSFLWMTQYTFLKVPNYVYIAIACLLLYGFIVAFTYLGSYISAIGENERAVRRIGINVNLVKTVCYVLGSFFFSIQALIITSKQGLASPSTGTGMEIIGITAVFLGVDSAYRNKSNSFIGVMFHLLVGVLIIAVMENGMLIMGWNLYIQYAINGVLLILAIALYYRKNLFMGHRNDLSAAAISD